MKKPRRATAPSPPAAAPRLSAAVDRSLVIKLYALAITDVVSARVSAGERTGPKTRD